MHIFFSFDCFQSYHSFQHILSFPACCNPSILSKLTPPSLLEPEPPPSPTNCPLPPPFSPSSGFWLCPVVYPTSPGLGVFVLMYEGGIFGQVDAGQCCTQPCGGLDTLG